MLLAVLAIGLVVGFATGGSLAQLGLIQFRGAIAVVFLYVMQGLARQVLPRMSAVSPSFVVWLWCCTTAALVALALLNIRLAGVPLIAAGLLLNLVVVAANAGMPVGAQVAASGRSIVNSSTQSGTDSFYRVVDGSTRLLPLADVIGFKGPFGFAALFSLGDLLMFAGVVVLVVAGMHGGSRRSS
jgi:hypothetical protein